MTHPLWTPLTVVALTFTSPALAMNLELRAFEEICEITGSTKISLRVLPASRSDMPLDIVVEPLS